MSRRLKLDMRNDCESVIAGVQHWYRPNNAATGQAVTLYERHPVSADSFHIMFPSRKLRVARNFKL